MEPGSAQHIAIVDQWHISQNLWDVIEVLIPKHPNTHRFGGGRPRKDMKLTRATLESIPAGAERPKPTAAAAQGLCLDKGYDYDEVREIAAEFRFTAHSRARGEEAQALKRKAGEKARRWVVERTH